MVSVLPPPTLDTCLKSLYKVYVEGAGGVGGGGSRREMLTFLAVVMTELLGVDEGVGYAHVFVGVKELGGKLRTALTSKAQAAVGEVRWVLPLPCCLAVLRCLALLCFLALNGYYFVPATVHRLTLSN